MNGLKAWPEADKLVWDVLGGRDHLSLMIRGHRFQSYTAKGRVKFPSKDVEYNDIIIKSTSMVYMDNSGKMMVLKISESTMGGFISPTLTIFDVRPAPWTCSWLKWIMDPNGDADPNYHRSRFEMGGLQSMSSDRILAFVEDVTRTKLTF